MSRILKAQIDHLEVQNDAQQKRIASQSKEIRRLKAALRALTEEDADEDVKMEEEDVPKREESIVDIGMADSESDEEAIEDDPPIWDKEDKVYRCIRCTGEVVDGLCQFCLARYPPSEGDEDEDDEARIFNEMRSISTDDDFLLSSRRLAPRGNTPLGEVDPSQLLPVNIAFGYAGREEEYRQLLSRGATRLMCERFRLEMNDANGIIAWVDEDLFEEFAGDAMGPNDQWKLYLGRELDLAPDDIDGSLFIEEFLEEATLWQNEYPSPFSPLYETVLEVIPDRIWATRPRGDLDRRIARVEQRNIFGDLVSQEPEPPSDEEEDDEYPTLSAMAEQDMEDISRGTLPASLFRDAYETDSELDDASDISDGGETIPVVSNMTRHGHTLDTIYHGSDEYSEDGEDYEDVDGVVVGRGNSIESDSDEADSDFDSDENLSGDEEVMAGAGRIVGQP
ncbi:hypothetical protein K474DRAFT_1771247 [Panus rudis PR-1116 ss-1]|nr:hypothetical protein K474DRAFT_1771247 [Panus rudis PR-1116 ss-1]